MNLKRLPLLATLVLGASGPVLALAPPPYAATQDAGVTELVTRGRALMAEGQLEEAVAALREADELDGGKLRTRRWLVRAMIEREYLNDALDLIDELAGAGNEGPAMDYLYGMAFVYKARKYIREGVNLGTVGMHYGDAVTYLGNATQAEGETYADAFLPLAEAAWHSQALDVARVAAERAVTLAPGDADALVMLGEVAFSQFVSKNGAEATQAEADADWQAAVDAFERAAAVKDAAAATAAHALKKAGDAYVWRGDLERAGARYAEALGLDPTRVDLGQVLNSLGRDGFLACVEAGATAFTQRYGERSTSDATLRWWLGWSRLEHQDYAGAQEAFAAAYTKWPAYINCNWYLGLCAYHQQDYDKAIELIARNFDLAPADLAGSLNGNFGLNERIVEYLIGQCAKDGKLLEAAKLSEALGLAAQTVARHWNNAGLFYRDNADRLGQAKDADPLELERLYEKSLACYETALSLEPENPNFLNDTAVVLHYNLGRDLERALELYKQSYAAAVKALERTDLSEEDRAVIQIAHRDSKNNRRLLERQLEEAREAAERARREEEARKRAEEEERKKREEEGAGGAGR